MIKLRFFCLAVLFLVSFALYADSPIPDGYKNVKLGMTLEETKDALLKDSSFGYHGDKDVSLLPNSRKVLIETDAENGYGSNFLKRCWFQFADDKLYIITINLNTNRIDYYSVFTKLCEKYGQPDKLNPQSATWKNDDYTMSLEKPLTLKYIDNKKFDELQSYSNVPLSGTEVTSKMFLDEL